MGWKDYYKFHLIKMDKVFMKYMPPFKNDVKVYLAGYFARYLDSEYKKQIQPILFKNPEELQALIRKHSQKLGQKSMIYFFAKVNAEYKLFSILIEYLIEHSDGFIFQLKEPANLYSIASIYSRLAGRTYHSLLYEYIYKRIQEVFSILFSYSCSINLDEVVKELQKVYSLELNLEDYIHISIENITNEDYQNFRNNLTHTIQNDITENEIKESTYNSLLFNFFMQS